ncbi:hypothetical protein TSUD_257920 [Trifolium subterraneum]|uniref:Uncharacterized protein n=1 Tax=Trifolium subterraneum TaxID=3900 RepID=A0A2Z6M2H6_TRISU|nr:hypothetical protein TSUD_257920 [Trifolium subterraneum]
MNFSNIEMFCINLSAAAANKLVEADFQKVACITSGLQTVKPGTFESVGSTELQNAAGKAGLVQIQGNISAVLGTGSSNILWKMQETQAASDQLGCNKKT